MGGGRKERSKYFFKLLLEYKEIVKNYFITRLKMYSSFEFALSLRVFL